jgi:hypothetical protein
MILDAALTVFQILLGVLLGLAAFSVVYACIAFVLLGILAIIFPDIHEELMK